MNEKEDNKKARIVRCPQCGKMTVYDLANEARPFCTARCQLIDAGAWADEDYRVAGDPAFPEDYESDT